MTTGTNEDEHRMVIKLARQARWSIVLGVLGMAPGVLYFAVPRVLYIFSGQYISGEGLTWLVFPAAVMPLVAGVPAIVLGACSAREINTSNRHLGVFGLLLGVMALGLLLQRLLIVLLFNVP
jgi:hypothetical protein